jgi:FAD:protein FMN transferase
MALSMDEGRDSSYFLEVARDAMACRFEILLHPGQPPDGPEYACKALDTIAFLEQLWSVYIPSSEFQLINLRALLTGDVSVSPSTFELLELALEVWRRTQGGFDITSNKLSKIWGFYRRQGRMPSEEEISQALREVGSQHIVLNPELQSVRLTEPVELNSGGIGKGAAIDSASQVLENAGVQHYAIHGGKSSMRCRGGERLVGETGWQVMVRHPEQSERALGHLRLIDQSLGTSGPANQFFYFSGKRYGHIIDPSTGWPVGGMLSMTVLHPSAGWADALATGLYVKGIEFAIEYCQNNPDTSILAILPGVRQGQVEIVTANMLPGQWNPL